MSEKKLSKEVLKVKSEIEKEFGEGVTWIILCVTWQRVRELQMLRASHPCALPSIDS